MDGSAQVSRHAMEKMVSSYPELAFVDPPSGQTHFGLFYNGFQGSLGDKRWVGERPTMPFLLWPR